MSKQAKITDPVNNVVEDIATEKDISKKEAIARVFQEAGYDV